MSVTTLLLTSFVVALIAGVPLADIVPTITAGMGDTLGFVAIVVGLGVTIGHEAGDSDQRQIAARGRTPSGDRTVVLATGDGPHVNCWQQLPTQCLHGRHAQAPLHQRRCLNDHIRVGDE